MVDSTGSTRLDTSELVMFNEFAKMNLQVGQVIAAERVLKSDKLIKMQVSFGGTVERQILGGIGLTYQPEDLVGGQYVFLVNLPVRKMMGLESHGMILAAGELDNLVLLTPSEIAPNGSRFG